MGNGEESLPATGLVVGIVLGVGVAASTALLLDQSPGLSAGYGAGAGLVVGALTGKLADANRGEGEWVTRVVGGGTLLGAVVGLGVGAVFAWAQSGTIASGALAGGLAGLLHGALVGAVLAANERVKE